MRNLSEVEKDSFYYHPDTGWYIGSDVIKYYEPYDEEELPRYLEEIKGPYLSSDFKIGPLAYGLTDHMLTMALEEELIEIDAAALVVHHTSTTEEEVDEMNLTEFNALHDQAVRNWVNNCIKDKFLYTCSL